MWSKNILAVMLILLILQILRLRSCTFISYQGDFLASIKYGMLKKNEDLCLLTCLEESDCTFVEYVNGVCTIFASGNTKQTRGNKVYEIRCELATPCKRRLKVAPAIEFQSLPKPTMKQPKTRKMELLGMKSTAALTVIYQFMNKGFVYSKNASPFSDGRKRARSLIFARYPQPECVSVPVFQTANQRKLYFGSIYNVTGYEFLDAYAFTTYCACEGTCCGQVGIIGKNVTIADRLFRFGYAMTFADQILYIADMLHADNISSAGVKSTICVDD